MIHKLQKAPLILAIFLLVCLLPICNKIKASEAQRNDLPERKSQTSYAKRTKHARESK